MLVVLPFVSLLRYGEDVHYALTDVGGHGHTQASYSTAMNDLAFPWTPGGTEMAFPRIHS